MQIQSSKSFARFFRQLCFIPFLHGHFFSKEFTTRLKQAVNEAERGHQGELVLIIENQLPLSMAYSVSCQARAVALFGQHRVWDTAQNTGVLIYLNVCERALEIVADRGIDEYAKDKWQALCQKATAQFAKGEFESGLVALIDDVADILKTHYPSDDEYGNELPNDVVFL